MGFIQLKFLVVALIAAVLVFSGCTQQAPPVSDQEYDNMVEEKLNEALKGQQDAQDIENGEDLDEPVIESEDSSVLPSNINNNFKTEATSLVYFDYVDTTNTIITLNGKFYKHPYLPTTTNEDGVWASYVFKGKMNWTYTEEVISALCEVTTVDVSGTQNLDVNDGALLTLETTKGEYLFALTKQIDVSGKEKIETVEDQPNCVDHQIQGTPLGFRLLSLYFSSPKPTSDLKSIKDSIDEVKDGSGEDFVNVDTYKIDWDMHLPSSG